MTRKVIVSQQETEVDGEITVKPTLKTDDGPRDAHLMEIVRDALRRRGNAWEREGHGSEFVFTTTVGTHPNRKNLRRDFKRMCKRAGIVDFVPHGLRHTASIGAMDAGVAVTEAAHFLGHKSPRMVTERYAFHPREAKQRDTAQAVAAHLPYRFPNRPMTM